MHEYLNYVLENLMYIHVCALYHGRSPYGICPSMGGTIPLDMTDAKNHILLFTIFNPMYPITVVSWLAEVMHDTAHL